MQNTTVEKEALMEMLKEHSQDMKNVNLSMAIIDEDRTERFFYDGTTLSVEVPHLIYEIGSVSKTFLSSLLAKLMVEGKITLNDSIDIFLPEINWPEKAVVPTIQQLVTHTSGIGNDIDCSTKEAADDLKKRLQEFSGDFENDCIYSYLDEQDYIETLRTIDWATICHGFNYSNIGATILGLILERVTGTPFETLMQTYIQKELGLTHTWTDMPAELPVGYCLAKPYGTDQKEKKHWIWRHKIGMAAGGIYSTLDDMTAYMSDYLNNTPDYLQSCYHEQLVYSEAHHFGLGMMWIKEENIIWHNGATGCFHSFVGFRTDIKRAVVILENHHETNEMSIDVIGKKILNELRP